MHTIGDVCSESFREVLRGALPAGGLGLCVYCVGVGEVFDPMRIDQDVVTLETNLLGLVKSIEVVLPALLLEPTACLVGLSSLADVMPSEHAPAYHASKVALSYYLEGLGRALQKSSVHVVNVRLGFVDTKMAKASVKPFLISAERAAERILEQVLVPAPPLRVNLPRRMAFLMRGLALIGAVARLLRRA
jgi:short-subunit dehydrogenase